MPICGQAENDDFQVEMFEYGGMTKVTHKRCDMTITIQNTSAGIEISVSGKDAKKVGFIPQSEEGPILLVTRTPFENIHRELVGKRNVGCAM